MPPREGRRPWLRFRRIPRTDLSEIEAVQLDPIQVAKFLDPLPHILAGVQRGPAHTLLLIEVNDSPAGFIVLHPDTRIGGCWWVGTLAIGHDYQGRGLGGLVLTAVLRRLRCVPALRAVRLLVVADNTGARRLYDKAGFRPVGYNPLADEILMEWVPGSHPTAADGVGDGTNAMGCSARACRRKFRLRPRSGRHVARVLGTERGPPAAPTFARLAACRT
jgi:ribosomal protein S18 acetylase RimI-like enzyme